MYAQENVVDAKLVDADDELWARDTMGEDANFGVVVAYKLRLIPVLPKVTVFSGSTTAAQGATVLLRTWETVTPREQTYILYYINQISSKSYGSILSLRNVLLMYIMK